MTTSENLKTEQEKTLSTPRRKYGILARLLFFSFGLIYGKKRTLSNFKVLEILARMPYQAWELAAYKGISKHFLKPQHARTIFDSALESRAQQDNEQWHMLIIQELIQKKNIKENYLLFKFAPRIALFMHYQFSRLLYAINPITSYRLNADFEDHAEHEYMEFVKENDWFANEPFESQYKKDYGSFDNYADVFMQIALDERQHKEDSLLKISEAQH